jgi:hypothetical protein
MSSPSLHVHGVLAAVVFHGLLGTAVWHYEARDEDERSRPPDFADAMTIEASLAYLSEKPKPTRQPQKPSNPMVAPTPPPGVSFDADRAPIEPGPDEPRPPDEFIDPSKTFAKARKFDFDEEPTDGADPETGSATGSEWGTAAEAKGDPYVGELHGRIKAVWKVPSLETGAGEALGCVRLASEGRIVDRRLWKPSGNANLDRSVDQALRDATDMDVPVPEHLLHLLTKKGICFRFKLEE